VRAAPAAMSEITPEAPASAVDATSNEAATSATPPVNPELVRAREVPAARRVGSNVFEILAFRGLSTPLALALVVLQGRFLEPTGRGRFVLAVLTVSIFSRLLSQLGVAVANHMGQKRWDTPPELRPLAQRALGIAVGLGLAGTAAIVAIGEATPSVGAGAAALAAAGLVPNVIWQTSSGILLGLGRIRPWNYVQLASPLLTVAGTLLLVVALGGQVHAALVAWTGAHVLTATLALWLMRDVWLPLRVPSLVDGVSQTLVRLALAMGALQVISLIGYRAELFVLEAIEGVKAVGIYSVANQAAESMWLMAAAIATAITAPVVRDHEHDAVALVRRSLVKSILYTAAAGAVVAITAPFVIRYALGDAFKEARTPLLLLLPGAIAYAPVQIIVVYLSVRRGRPRLSLLAGVVAMVVTVGASVPLISSFGASGAAGASAIGYACGALVAFELFRRMTSRRGGQRVRAKRRTAASSSSAFSPASSASPDESAPATQ
jgi:O-antigen/teichoic acid export membrane protein